MIGGRGHVAPRSRPADVALRQFAISQPRGVVRMGEQSKAGAERVGRAVVRIGQQSRAVGSEQGSVILESGGHPLAGKWAPPNVPVPVP
jgi:hypothetical protein